MIKRVCVFCGSSAGARPVYARAAVSLAEGLAGRKIGIVYGGSSAGLMGVLANAALQARGEVIGVIPRSLVAKEAAHPGLSDLRVVESMHQRKALMADLSDAFIAMPGGYGTLDEFCEVLTWNQLGLLSKPCGILNTAGYFDHLLRLFDHAVEEHFLKASTRRVAMSESDPEALIERLVSAGE
jgi:uncharacterized protein (TIGR00730 family)